MGEGSRLHSLAPLQPVQHLLQVGLADGDNAAQRPVLLGHPPGLGAGDERATHQNAAAEDGSAGQHAPGGRVGGSVLREQNEDDHS